MVLNHRTVNSGKFEYKKLDRIFNNLHFQPSWQATKVRRIEKHPESFDQIKLLMLFPQSRENFLGGFKKDFFMGVVHSIYTTMTLKKKDLAWWLQSSSAHSWVHRLCRKTSTKNWKIVRSSLLCPTFHTGE